jgi:hypothetical protein
MTEENICGLQITRRPAPRLLPHPLTSDWKVVEVGKFGGSQATCPGDPLRTCFPPIPVREEALEHLGMLRYSWLFAAFCVLGIVFSPLILSVFI